MRPTIGRSVHFRQGGHSYAATVLSTQTDESSVVDLVVFGFVGPLVQKKTRVQQDESPSPAPGTWCWPPRVE